MDLLVGSLVAIGVLTFFFHVLGKHLDIDFPLPRNHPIQFIQTVFVMLHQGKVGLVMIRERFMREAYPKKD
jgi:hypothetical protein